MSSLRGMSTAAVVRRKVIGFLRADATFLPGFEPVALEYGFGPESVGFGGFVLRGRIDRIDRGPSGELIAVDYKTGTVGSAHAVAKFASRGLLQLPLYARVIQDAFGAPVAGGLYRGVSALNVRLKQNRGFYSDELVGEAGLVGTDRMDADGIAEVLSDAESRAAEAVGGMRGGRIPAEPLEDASCKSCGFATMCPGVRR